MGDLPVKGKTPLPGNTSASPQMPPKNTNKRLQILWSQELLSRNMPPLVLLLPSKVTKKKPDSLG
ncbi:hypothetical protein, partial [Escherichia coli]|uniref:hypothetical protein n=1 Tax=Escherichia coli TaxID=562 RepID=UPI003CEA1643